MFNNVQLIFGALSIAAIALAVFMVQVRLDTARVSIEETQVAQVVEPRLEVINQVEVVPSPAEIALAEAIKTSNNFSRMVIDDIKEGSGTEVVDGSEVLVHYAGSLQDGTEFDNSRNRGEAFSFTVGAQQVIKGWDEGLLGMKEGGERVLVIPPEKGYGEQGIGPIPGNATLVFKIELLEVK